MGDVIVKVAPDRDEYMIWSTVVEAPTFVGNREELIAHLGDVEGECPTCHFHVTRGQRTSERIARADERGSSSYDRCWWWGEKEIYAQLGYLDRENLPIVLALAVGGAPYDDERIRIHLERFEDDETAALADPAAVVPAPRTPEEG